MPSYTLKEGACAGCGSTYTGLICDDEPHLNTCPNCTDGSKAVENAQSLRYRHYTPYWDSGLGMVVSGKRQRDEEIRARGLVETSDVAPNSNYIVDDMSSYARAAKRQTAPDKMDDGFLDAYREAEANG